MCIRDSAISGARPGARREDLEAYIKRIRSLEEMSLSFDGCLLYTSDAADERSSVDLGGRRIIKKKKNHNSISSQNITHYTSWTQTNI